MITKIDGKYFLICDICGDIAQEVFYAWQDAIDAKKDLRWRSKLIRVDGQPDKWQDVCPDRHEVDKL